MRWTELALMPTTFANHGGGQVGRLGGRDSLDKRGDAFGDDRPQRVPMDEIVSGSAMSLFRASQVSNTRFDSQLARRYRQIFSTGLSSGANML
jgi:hypothetical protein